MNITYPITFTVKGPGWKEPCNKITVTILYDSGSKISTNQLTKSMLTEPFIFLDSSGESDSFNGYFGNLHRITNIVGYDGKTLLKSCPKCKKIKPLTGFDYSGRHTANEWRDQSNCSDCRKSYNSLNKQ